MKTLVKLKVSLIISIRDEAVFNYAIQKQITFKESFKRLTRIQLMNEFVRQLNSTFQQSSHRES
jgi:putative flippase GtrA